MNKRTRFLISIGILLFLAGLWFVIALLPSQAHDFSNVRVIAHRGYDAPDNSLLAYENAANAGFEYVETDVRFTKDNIPICIHDVKVDDISNGQGFVEELTLREIQSMNFSGSKILLFEDFVAFCADHKLSPYVDIKNYSSYTKEQMKILVDMISSAGLSDDTTWISYDFQYLRWISKYNPTARLGLISSGVGRDVISAAELLKTKENEVFIDTGSVSAQGVELCKAADIPLECWTLRRVPDKRTYIDPYISGFTTDCILD